MTWLELGGMAGSIVSIWSLVSKLVHLIATIQGLIGRIDGMQESLSRHQEIIVHTQNLARDNAQAIRLMQAQEGSASGAIQDLKACATTTY